MIDFFVNLKFGKFLLSFVLAMHLLSCRTVGLKWPAIDMTNQIDVNRMATVWSNTWTRTFGTHTLTPMNIDGTAQIRMHVLVTVCSKWGWIASSGEVIKRPHLLQLSHLRHLWTIIFRFRFRLRFPIEKPKSLVHDEIYCVEINFFKFNGLLNETKIFHCSKVDLLNDLQNG